MAGPAAVDPSETIHPTRPSLFRSHALPVLGVLACLLGAWLRLDAIDLAPFGTGEVDPLRICEGMFDGVGLPLYGADIGPGVFRWGRLGPLHYYLMAPLVGATRSWLGADLGGLIGLALVMLVAFWVLRSGFVGRSRMWWNIALWIQFWHHIEHALLQGQAIVGHNLLGRPVPMSVLQFWLPRVELHLFYNTVVFVPMALAMYFHMFPPRGEEAHGRGCNCAWTPKAAKKGA